MFYNATTVHIGPTLNLSLCGVSANDAVGWCTWDLDHSTSHERPQIGRDLASKAPIATGWFRGRKSTLQPCGMALQWSKCSVLLRVGNIKFSKFKCSISLAIKNHYNHCNPLFLASENAAMTRETSLFNGHRIESPGQKHLRPAKTGAVWPTSRINRFCPPWGWTIERREAAKLMINGGYWWLLVIAVDWILVMLITVYNSSWLWFSIAGSC